MALGLIVCIGFHGLYSVNEILCVANFTEGIFVVRMEDFNAKYFAVVVCNHYVHCCIQIA